jgi:hypothetical protein
MLDKKLNNFDNKMYLCIKFLGKVVLFNPLIGKQHYEENYFLLCERILPSVFSK